MYRVAILLNERELLVSGYANLTPRLGAIDRLSEYEFNSYTSVNIGEFVEQLTNFDGVVIGTNATSDKVVLNALRANRDRLGDFIAAGKGILILSQKKLSVRAVSVGDQRLGTGFLPENLDFITVERPSSEEDSGIGQIDIVSGFEDHPILVHPRRVTSEAINARCADNPFRRHYYRSTVEPLSHGAFCSVLADRESTGSQRDLVMVSATPSTNGRVVASTVVLDWAFHEDLLTNSIVFVTEGPPRLAFIDKLGAENTEFSFLITTAKVSKIAHVVFESPQAIPGELASSLNTYVFAPEWLPEEVADVISADQVRIGINKHRRYYFFSRSSGLLTLCHHSTFSTVDLLIERSVQWIDSQFESGFWKESFWVSHDVIRMMGDVGHDVTPYVKPVLTDICKHLKNGSYDGVMGATCGMLDVVGVFWSEHRHCCEDCGFNGQRIGDSVRWILEHVDSQSDQDRIVAFLALTKLLSIKPFPDIASHQAKLTESVYRGLRYLHNDESPYGEIGICRQLEALLICQGGSNDKLLWLVGELSARQSANGSWGNVGRTAHVLASVLTNWGRLQAGNIGSEVAAKLESAIYRGILYLRERFDWGAGCWDGDVQASAKATHAISLHNRIFNYSTQDFLHALGLENDKVETAKLLATQAGTIAHLRDTANSARALSSRLASSESARKAAACKLRILQPVASCSLLLLASICAYLYFEQRQALKDLIKALGVVSLVGGAVFGLILNWLINAAPSRKGDKN